MDLRAVLFMDIRAVANCFLRILQVFITVFQKSVFVFEHRHKGTHIFRNWSKIGGPILQFHPGMTHTEVIGPI